MSKVVLVGLSIFAQWDRASHAFVGRRVEIVLLAELQVHIGLNY